MHRKIHVSRIRPKTGVILIHSHQWLLLGGLLSFFIWRSKGKEVSQHIACFKHSRGTPVEITALLDGRLPKGCVKSYEKYYAKIFMCAYSNPLLFYEVKKLRLDNGIFRETYNVPRKIGLIYWLAHNDKETTWYLAEVIKIKKTCWMCIGEIKLKRETLRYYIPRDVSG